MDYQANLYDPIYTTLGVPATLSGMATGETLTVIEDTVSDEQDFGDSRGGYVSQHVQTIKPAAFVRAVELAEKGVSLSSLRGQSITYNGATRRIEYYKIVPSPKGEADGQVCLVLIAAE